VCRATPHLHNSDAEITLIGFAGGRSFYARHGSHAARVLFYSPQPCTCTSRHPSTSTISVTTFNDQSKASSTFLNGNSSHQRRASGKSQPAFAGISTGPEIRGNTLYRAATIVRSGIVVVAVSHTGAQSDWDFRTAQRSHEVHMMTERINEKHAPRSSRYKSQHRRNRRALGHNDHRV
jgi:hypothetical protein